MYPYRDRSIPLYYAIRSYVQEILGNYYRKYQNEYSKISYRHKDVEKDSEIQAWRTMLEKSMVYGGAGIQHLPGSSKGSMNLKDLVDIVTTVLFQATAYHSAVNGELFDNAGIPANYPIGLRKPPPTTKLHPWGSIEPRLRTTGLEDISEQDILDSLPNKFTTFDTGVIATILGLEMGNFLVEMERYLLHSPEDMMAREKFIEKLKNLDTVDYPDSGFPYTSLNIGRIAVAIDHLIPVKVPSRGGRISRGSSILYLKERASRTYVTHHNKISRDAPN
ncbi:Hydroperoxide isomerase ALOXE3 [Nymphon striatum]|nr:Hydroperoxide isomerase ALOXE3 [Nymphon striatum]